MKRLCLVVLVLPLCSGCATKWLYDYGGRMPSRVEGFREATHQGDKIVIGYNVSLEHWSPRDDDYGVRWTAVVDLSERAGDEQRPALRLFHEDLFASSEIRGEGMPIRYTAASRPEDFSRHDDTYAIYEFGEWFYLLLRDPADAGREREYRYDETEGDSVVSWWRPLVFPLFPFTLVWDIATYPVQFILGAPPLTYRH